MSFAKSVFQRLLRLAALAGGIWKEKVFRRMSMKDLTPARIQQVRLLIEELGKLKSESNCSFLMDEIKHSLNC